MRGPRNDPAAARGTPDGPAAAARPAGAAAGSAGGTRANYTDGPVEAHVRRLSLFMMLGFLAMTLAQFIEALYLGRVGSDELAAVAFTFPLTLALNAMVRGIGIGASAVVARSIGAGDGDAAGRLTSHCLLLVLGVALAFVVAAWLWSDALFTAMGAPPHVARLATLYTHVWFIGFPMFALSMVGAGLIRAAGDAAWPGYVMTLGSVLQVVIAPFLIFGWLPGSLTLPFLDLSLPGLQMEPIAGAAWSFVIARAISLAMTAHWFLRGRAGASTTGHHRTGITLTRSLHRFADSSRAILHVGLPSVFTNLVPSISTGIVTAMLAGYGHAVVAGFGVASRVEALVSMVVIAISSSTGPMVGQNWGAGQVERVHATLRACYRYCLAWGVLAGAFMWVAGRHLVALINDDPALVDAATLYLHIVPFSIGFMGVMAVASASFNALGKPLPPLLLALARALVLYVPVAWLAGRWFGYPGIFAATAAANVVMGAIAWRWQRHALRAAISARGLPAHAGPVPAR
jgi:putative MATE family efflux protein